MLEKSPTHSNESDDVTRVKSADSSELAPNPQSSITSSTQTTNDKATQMMTSYPETGSPTDGQLEIGSVVKHTYQLVDILGEGGMGTVFKALNKDWEEVGARDPYVALKVLKPELSDNRDLVMGLFREFDRIKMLAGCPNTIKVYNFGRDGTHIFMAMEYLTGQALSEYLNRQPMMLTQAWFIIEGVGNALAFAHQHNIVHRDIKPGNIFITKEGVVKVLDFGIASKINENEDDRTKFNGDDVGAFTLAYASPDTRLGDPPDCRDDIYSFACVIYEILTGKKFFDPKRRSKKAEPIHGLNSKQMEALNKALAFEREQRTASIGELLDKLRPVKTPWIKYASIGGGIVLVIGLAVVFKPDTVPPKQETVITPPKQETVVTPPKQETVITPPKQETVVTPPKQDTDVTPPKQDTVITPPKQDTDITPPKQDTDVTPPKQDTVVTPPKQDIVIEPPKPDIVLQSGTSSDGVIQLQTSKPEYKNGEFFHLNFTLTQPSYVRIIDRDVKGVETVLRPNPLQPDKLLPANKEHAFPPKDIDVPVQGIAGNNTVTIVASNKPFPKVIKLLNPDGSVSEQIQRGSYSWTQVHYTLSH